MSQAVICETGNISLGSDVFTSGGSFLTEGVEITVPENSYFLCGDNRPHSSDSRTFGPISESAIKGKAWLIYYPFSQFRIAQHESYTNL